MSDRDDNPPGYPTEWEADVLLTDGGAARLRPIKPSDESLLVEFYARVSAESKYLRFFAPYPRLSPRDVYYFTHVDYVDRVALIMTVRDRMIAVGRFDRLENETGTTGWLARRAEVSFLVEDAHQGRGVAQLLLEHLADAARERGITGFVAEVLPENKRMAQVFVDAGYHVSRAVEDGVLQVEFPILPTDTAVGVMERREHRAEASSMERLLNPERVVVLGAGARVQDIVVSLLTAGFRGKVVAVSVDDVEVSGVPTAGSIAELEPGIDLVVAALPPADLGAVVIEAAHKGAHGMVVLTGSGAAPATGVGAGPERAEAEDALMVSLVRAYGLRALGPDALGLINTDPQVALNASPGPMPRTGQVAMFCQAPAVGVAMLSGALRQALGLSSFISTGAFADVTANDVMQFWEDDDRTRVCLLSLDRIGNPRKFSRIVRRLTRRKPVVVYQPGQAERGSHSGDRGGLHRVSAPAVDAMFRQSGVIVVHHRQAMFDISQILARQPLPAGPRTRVVTNSRSLARQMERTVVAVGLVGTEPVVLPPTADVADLAAATAAALADPDCDAVVSAVVNAFGTITSEMHEALEGLAQNATKPLLGVFIEFGGESRAIESDDLPGGLPVFRGQGDALQALAAVTAYAHWRERDPGAVPMLEVDSDAARLVVNKVLAHDPSGRRLTADEATTLLRAYGITLVPQYVVGTLDAAVQQAEALGWNVVLKATADSVRGRPDLAGVFRHLDSAEEMAQAWDDLRGVVQNLGQGGSADDAPAQPGSADVATAAPVVQAMMPAGVSLVLESREDPAFGPVLSLGMDGIASQILGDIVYRVPPLTTVDAAAMVRDLRATPLLFGWQGSPRVDVAAVETLLHRVAQLADALPQLAVCRLGPCIATSQGIRVVGARIEIAPSLTHRDPMARTLD